MKTHDAECYPVSNRERVADALKRRCEDFCRQPGARGEQADDEPPGQAVHRPRYAATSSQADSAEGGGTG